MRVNRRRFLTLAGSGAGALVWARSPRMAAWAQEPVAGPNDPDLVVLNAKIYTVDEHLPKAEAFAIKAGRFQAVGSSADIRNLARRDTPVFDAQQMTIVPGFIDCHHHAEGEVLLYEAATFENPNQLSQGMRYVLVNGVPVIDAGKATDALPGKVLRGPGFQMSQLVAH
jgi:hypothetical protein